MAVSAGMADVGRKSSRELGPVRTGQQGAREGQQVVRDRGAPCVGAEVREARPCAARQPKGALEKGDGRFDPGAKAFQDPADSGCGSHLVDRHTGRLGKAGFARSRGLERLEIASRRETAVEGGALGCG